MAAAAGVVSRALIAVTIAWETSRQKTSINTHPDWPYDPESAHAITR
jgi:hypothetical protein